MDRTSAIRLVSETFQYPFDKDRFAKFVRELLNRYDERTFVYQGNYIPDAFKKCIKSCERIGQYTDPNDRDIEIDILVVSLQRETSLVHARTMQRNFIATYLNGSRGGKQKEAALVAVVAPNPEDWRFSLVRMDYKLTRTPSGDVTAREELTSARRYSFLVGQNEDSHTAQTCFLPLLENDKTDPTLDELEKAFSIERVTKEFFESYRELFRKVKDALDKIVVGDSTVRTDFDNRDVKTADFAKKLLGQIVFLYFLQKKGWLGVPREAAWGGGPRNFLRLLFGGGITPYKSFFNDVLEPLFYDALADDRRGKSDWYERFGCRIPFLNGGLFDPIGGYDWAGTDIVLPNSLFSNDTLNAGDTGDGILDVFDRFNFTVKEDEPLEKEVAIDPEMLGKVFEGLQERPERKAGGAFYTPREIVHYMCQESLIHYLATEVPDVPKPDIEALIRHGDAAIENDARVEAVGRETKRYPHKLRPPIRDNAAALDGKLASIRVCDPAVGSGAFLVGMMNEIVRARQVLGTFLDQTRTPYELKRHAIQDCLYGVDIAPGAVDIAKLRLWLSLVVDEEEIGQIKPLPNLDYKIMQGNSLLEEYEGIKLFDDTLLSQGSSTDESPVESLRQRLRELQRDLISIHNSGGLTRTKKQLVEAESKKLAASIERLLSGPVEDNSPSLEQVWSGSSAIADRIKELHTRFFDEVDKEEKDKIKAQIAALEWDLIETTLKEQGKADSLTDIQRLRNENIKPYFLWKLHFAEVFGDSVKGGFDVVIANPPYVRMELRKNIRDALSSQYPHVHAERADLYCYFYALAIRILRCGGVMAFISSNKWFRAGYGAKLRKHIADTCQVHCIVDFGELPVFENAATFPMVFIASRSDIGNLPTTFVQVRSLDPPYPDVPRVVADLGESLPVAALSGGTWTVANANTADQIRKMEQTGLSLQGYVDGNILTGIKTGYNQAFWLNEDQYRSIVAQQAECEDLLKPLLVGDDVRRWRIKEVRRWIIYTPQGVDISRYPAIADHLRPYVDRLSKRALSQEWYELQQASLRYSRMYSQPKIVYPDIAMEPRFAYDTNGFYIDMTAFAIPVDDLFILGILNSESVWQYLCQRAAVLGDTGNRGRLRLKRQYLEGLPIPQSIPADRSAIESLVRKCLDANGVDCEAWEKDIDERVAALYGL